MLKPHQHQFTSGAAIPSWTPRVQTSHLICASCSDRSPLYNPPTNRRELLLLSGVLLTSSLITPKRADAIVTTTESPAIDIAATSLTFVTTVGSLSGDNFTALASGVVWTSQGHVVTAYSPVNGALRQQQNLVIATQDTSNGGAVTFTPVKTVVAREPSLDLIVLQADVSNTADNTNRLVVSRSKDLKIGQDVFLIGSSPDGSRSLAAGVLSATNRSIPAPNGQAIRGALQTDVNVTALGLGGALVDSKGHLIGIPTVSYSRPGTARSSGVNFALPSDALIDAVPKLIAYGNLSGRR